MKYGDIPCVYIMTNCPRGVLYVGVTSQIIGRVWHHKAGTNEGFTKKYWADKLVWFEVHATMESAILREKTLKKWKRAWKIRLIEKTNPGWRDLYNDIVW